MITGELILRQRLRNQRLTGAPFEVPEEVVRHLVGVQSQDYANARWSLGQRTRDCTDAAVERACDAGLILRTHVLRPTWHFVLPADIRWLLALTAPRVNALNAYYYRKLELDGTVFAHTQALFAAALEGHQYLTRAELAALLARAGIVADKLRLAYIVMRAELDGLICSGASRGKQQTYALLDERAPGARRLTEEEALAELTRRFFAGHGPVTLRDYVRWSSLTIAEASRGLALVGDTLEHDSVDGLTFWFDAWLQPPQPTGQTAYLLPEYDECYLTYTDLNFPDLPWAIERESWRNTYYRPIVIGGARAGTWRRTIAKGAVTLEANLFAALDAAQSQALQAAAERYGRFLGLPVTLLATAS